MKSVTVRLCNTYPAAPAAMISLITTASSCTLKMITLNSRHLAWSYLMKLTCPLWVAKADIDQEISITNLRLFLQVISRECFRGNFFGWPRIAHVCFRPKVAVPAASSRRMLRMRGQVASPFSASISRPRPSSAQASLARLTQEFILWRQDH